MSYIESQLQPGEQVLFRINRGRKWYHYILLVIEYFILAPFLFWITLYFLVPILGRFLPQAAALLSVGGLLFLLSLGLLLDFMHFLLDDIALTDRRIVGRAQGTTTLAFQKIDVPLSVIASATATGGFVSPMLEIRRKDGKPALFMRNLGAGKQFAAKLTELINRPV
jgi:hypothetical protein